MNFGRTEEMSIQEENISGCVHLRSTQASRRQIKKYLATAIKLLRVKRSHWNSTRFSISLTFEALFITIYYCVCMMDSEWMFKIVMPRHKHIQRSKFSPVDETKWRLGNYCHKLIILLFYIWDFSANFDLVLYPILVCLLNCNVSRCQYGAKLCCKFEC